ncbi:MAG: hypothetical protein NC548_13230 [Lachnospiraceae bacterium]|nr:hypothetical protein [Lachnospiraceae bacterium]MCM1230647.1 hypothetical protein [Ruminococcus flavefaciens]MCM1439997.1 hypothetical protein [Roseburia sp.]
MFFDMEPQLLIEFHNTVINSLDKKEILPVVINNPLVSDRYKRGEFADEYYGILFSCLDHLANNDLDSCVICSSDDIEDSSVTGDYIYWGGQVTDNLSFILMEATHPWHYPHRAILYDPNFRIHISAGTPKIMISSGSREELSKFFITDRPSKEVALKEILQRFDRPKLIDVYEKGEHW